MFLFWLDMAFLIIYNELNRFTKFTKKLKIIDLAVDI